MADLERYLNIQSAYGASLGPNDELAFLLDTTGVPQVWSLTEPRKWPEQRTFYDERVTFVSYSPERPELAFGMDEGGNERAQLFALDPDGEITPLTGMPDAKHRWGGWSHDGERFAFASNRREEAVFDVYTQGRTETGRDAECVFEGDGWLSVGGFAPDDGRLLVSKAYSNFDQDLYALDVASGETDHLTPHEDDVRYGSAQWNPAGDALYLVTDRDTDTLRLARLDLATKDLETVVSGGEWNVDGVALDDETGRLAYSRNVDGYTELTVGQLSEDRTGDDSDGGGSDVSEAGGVGIETFPTPELPKGVVGGVSFGPDAERFAITTVSPQQNTNVHVVEVETGETERWTAASTAGLARERFRAPELVRYESFDGREIPAFFSLPSGANANENGDGDTPVIVDIHGGPESQRRPSFSPLTQYFLEEGYGVFEPNVRGSAGYGKAYSHLDDVENRLDSVADIEAGVEWLCGQSAVDPDRIVALGGSYGGFMVLSCLTEYPDLWAAGVDIVGIASFVTFLENTGEWRRALREAEYGSLAEDREFLESISPINSVENIAAPLFVLHGANDPRVPVGETEQIADGAREQGVPVETMIFEDEGHGITKRENRIEAYTAVVEFLDTHV